MYGRTVEVSWLELKEVRSRLVRKEIVMKKRKIGWAGWWDCKRQKRKVKKAYKDWKGGGMFYTGEEKGEGTNRQEEGRDEREDLGRGEEDEDTDREIH